MFVNKESKDDFPELVLPTMTACISSFFIPIFVDLPLDLDFSNCSFNFLYLVFN